MSRTVPGYCYSPLSAPDSIRLIRLIPNETESADIQCELFEYPLKKLRKRTHLYEALSYVWGSWDNPRSISIGQHDFTITKNLYAALLCLRDCSFIRIIWIDAICINQADNQEKQYQVEMMGKIYSQACCVLVWLGEAVDGSDQAVEEIRLAAD